MSLAQLRTPWIIAHRGVPLESPENTLASFARAMNQGTDFIELDVHMSADNQLVVIHDDTLERTTNGSGLVSEFTLRELRSFDAGCWMSDAYCGEKIPLLSEVLAQTKGSIGVVIELKHGSERYPNIEHVLVNAIEQFQRKEDVIVICGESAPIKLINENYPDIMTLDFRHDPIKSPSWTTAEPWSQPMKRFVFTTPDEAAADAIAHLHSLGLGVLTSLIQQKTTLEGVTKLIEADVDGIFTDEISNLRDILSSIRSKK